MHVTYPYTQYHEVKASVMIQVLLHAVLLQRVLTFG